MWYNEGNQILCAQAMLATSLSWSYLVRRYDMSSISHHAQKGKVYTVYALIDPRDQFVRYIGITYDVYQRMRQHSRCEGNNTAKNAWIAELQREQYVFIMHSIEKVTSFEKALERESYWIHYYLQKDVKLFNIAGTSESFEKPKKPLLNLATIFLQLQDGTQVSVQDAPHELFDVFIRHFIPVEESDVFWHNGNRRKAIEYAWQCGIKLPLFEFDKIMPLSKEIR